jgi:hypothetical protein
MKSENLRPGDVVLAVSAAMRPGIRLAELAEVSGRSIGEAHNAVRRLRAGGLMDGRSRAVDVEALVQFVVWGVPVVFPARRGDTTIGTVTAVNRIPELPPQTSDWVWPDAEGVTRGAGVMPLHDRVPSVVRRDPRLHAALALVDLARTGGARDRAAAASGLESLFRSPSVRG